jgi:putative ABC transport system permease protein
MVNVNIPAAKYATPASQMTFIKAVLQRFRALPGVTAVGATNVMPMSGADYVLGLEIEGRPVPESDLPTINFYSVSPGYFEATRIPLQRGRAFTEQDREGNNQVAIISQSLADKLFPGEEPLGKRVHPTQGPRNFREIVGVVADVKQYGVERETAPQCYVPLAQFPFGGVSFIVRTSIDPLTLGPTLRQEVYAVDPEQPVARLDPLANLLKVAMARQRFAATLFTVFSALALVLAAVGIYGVMAYAVSQRTNEFGIRIALGAQRSDILTLVLAHGGRLTVIGLLVGLLAALAAGKLMQSLLYQTPARDPLVFAAIALLLGSVAVLACLLPARRATKVDPMVALRAE